MKKIYLHMGFHKTATSSFQSTCAANLTLLNDQGYLYPAFHYKGLRKGRQYFNHSGPIFSAFTEAPESYGFNIKEKVKNLEEANAQYLKLLDEFLSSDHDLILSGEGISALTEQSLNRLFTYLKKNNATVIPIACVRSPYEFHCSSAQTVIKHGRHVKINRLRTQNHNITKLKNTFGDEINFIAFNQARRHPNGPVAYLLEYCGVKCSSFEFVTTNERRSNVYVRLQNEFNKEQPKVVNNKLNPKHQRAEMIAGDPFLLTHDELANIQEQLDKENEFFLKTLGPEFCDQKIKVSEVLNSEQLMEAYPSQVFIKPNKIIQMVKQSKLFNYLSNSGHTKK